MDSALARGVSWGFGEDAVAEPEDLDPAAKVLLSLKCLGFRV